MRTISDMIGRDEWGSVETPKTIEDVERKREELKQQRALFRAQRELWKEREEFRVEVIEETKDDTLADSLEEMMEGMVCHGLSVWRTKHAHTRVSRRF